MKKSIFNRESMASRVWEMIIFIGVFPAFFFLVGMKAQKIISQQDKLKESTMGAMYRAQNIGHLDESFLSLEIITPKGGDVIDLDRPINVTWDSSYREEIPKVTLLLLDQDGKSVSKIVISENIGWANIPAPTKPNNGPYSILIQGLPVKKGVHSPYSYSGDFFFSNNQTATR